jgi:hypothetical protein
VFTVLIKQDWSGAQKLSIFNQYSVSDLQTTEKYTKGHVLSVQMLHFNLYVLFILFLGFFFFSFFSFGGNEF